MNDLRPFRGLRYNQDMVGPLGNVVCPPYDVISKEDAQSLYEKGAYNAVRLEFGLEYHDDDSSNNRYTRAAAFLERWIAKGALEEEAEPALYVYEQQFPLEGKTVVRRGILGALGLTPWEEGVVLPHEETMPKPKADRLQLMRATECNFSPLFLLFDDSTGNVVREMEVVCAVEPIATADAGNGQIHRLWVAKGAAARQLAEALRTPQLYMADGHHRYETALAYREEKRASDPSASDDAAYNYALVLLVEAHDPGLVVLPTHRLVRGVGEQLISALDRGLSSRFDVKNVTVGSSNPAQVADALLREMADEGQQTPALGLYRAGEALVLKLRGSIPRHGNESRPLLDVDVLHEGLMEPFLGIGLPELKAGGYVTYTRDAAEAVAAVDRGEVQLALLLNPTKVEQVLDTARAYGKMPQKSTYFYPKAITGLVFHSLK